jgi:hypothetical protein
MWREIRSLSRAYVNPQKDKSREQGPECTCDFWNTIFFLSLSLFLFLSFSLSLSLSLSFFLSLSLTLSLSMQILSLREWGGDVAARVSRVWRESKSPGCKQICSKNKLADAYRGGEGTAGLGCFDTYKACNIVSC